MKQKEQRAYVIEKRINKEEMKMSSDGNGKSRRIGREGENAHHLFDKMPKRTAYYLSIKNSLLLTCLICVRELVHVS